MHNRSQMKEDAKSAMAKNHTGAETTRRSSPILLLRAVTEKSVQGSHGATRCEMKL